MRFQLLSFVAAIAACSGSGSGKATTSASGQRTFPTPDSAVQAVFHALATNDTTLLMDIMGPDSRPVVMQADQVQAARERQVVATAASFPATTVDGRTISAPCGPGGSLGCTTSPLTVSETGFIL